MLQQCLPLLISPEIRKPQKTDLKGRREGLLPDNHKKLRIVATWGLLQEMQNSGLTET